MNHNDIEIDPNETLEELRRLSREGVTDGTEWKSQFDALDKWLTDGGPRPIDWEWPTGQWTTGPKLVPETLIRNRHPRAD